MSLSSTPDEAEVRASGTVIPAGARAQRRYTSAHPLAADASAVQRPLCGHVDGRRFRL